MRRQTPPPPMLSRRRVLACGSAALLGGHFHRSLFGDVTAKAEENRQGAAPAGPAPMQQFRAHRVSVRGRHAHSMVPAAPIDGAMPLVLVHGLALSGTYMMPTADRLAADFNVYIPDFAGFGDSAKPPRIMDVPALADWLADWMTAMGLKTAAMLGNSFGCQIIGDFAARYPDRILRGVLQGPTAPPEERTWIMQALRWRANAPHNPPEMGDIAADDYAKTGIVRALMTFEFSLRDALEDKAARIRAPMLVVRGGIDPISSQEWCERLVRDLPDGELAVIPDVAHTLVFTHPSELADASRPFLLAHRPLDPANA